MEEFKTVELTPTPEQASTGEAAPYGYKADGTPKKTAGRPKKTATAPDENEAQKEVKKEPKKGTLNFDEMRAQVQQNQQAQQQAQIVQPTETPATEIVKLIDGYMLLAMLDVACPVLLKFLLKKQLAAVPASKMQLTNSQKESLEPLADLAALEIQKYVNPMVAFTIVVGYSYYNNGIEYLEKSKK